MWMKSALSTGASQMENPVHQWAEPRSQALQTVFLAWFGEHVSLCYHTGRMVMLKLYANNKKRGETTQCSHFFFIPDLLSLWQWKINRQMCLSSKLWSADDLGMIEIIISSVEENPSANVKAEKHLSACIHTLGQKKSVSFQLKCQRVQSSWNY